ncbi:MAG: hypothetical protein NHB14_11720 [Desulfosporosinus sp.]|nr:hypothetical protein [Desulfosporosinus sp.]
MYSKTQVYLELLAVFPIFLLIIFTLPDNLSWPLRSTIGITGASVWLWVLEPIPLWMTESFHKLPTAVPAILATVFMGLPGIGIVGWDKLKEIEGQGISLALRFTTFHRWRRVQPSSYSS